MKSFSEKKSGGPRSLNPIKVIAMAICPIIVRFSTWRARSMHDVACEFNLRVQPCAVRNNWPERP